MPSDVSGVGTIMASVPRSVLRGVVGMVFVFGVPLLVMFYVGTVEKASNHPVLGITLPASAPRSESQLVGDLEHDKQFAVRLFATRLAATVALKKGSVAGVLVMPVLPPGSALTQLVNTPFAPEYSTAAGFPADLSTEVTSDLGGALTAIRAALAVHQTTGVALDHVEPVAQQMESASNLKVTPESSSGVSATGETSSFSYAAPAALLMFTFLAAGATAMSLVGERVTGVSTRLRASPMSDGSILLGRLGGRMMLGTAQAAVIVLGSMLFFGVTWGNSLLGLIAIELFIAIAGAMGLIVGSVASSGRQALAAISLLGVGFGMLGGCFWPLWIVGPDLRRAALITPHGWAMQVLTDAQARGTFTGAGTALGVLAGIAAAVVVAAGAVTKSQPRQGLGE